MFIRWHNWKKWSLQSLDSCLQVELADEIVPAQERSLQRFNIRFYFIFIFWQICVTEATFLQVSQQTSWMRLHVRCIFLCSIKAGSLFMFVCCCSVLEVTRVPLNVLLVSSKIDMITTGAAVDNDESRTWNFHLLYAERSEGINGSHLCFAGVRFTWWLFQGRKMAH